MTFDKFLEYSKNYNVIPVYDKITADLLTPVLAYLKLRETHKNCFLLESVEGIGKVARYSFIGIDPVKIIKAYGNKIEIFENGIKSDLTIDLFQFLKTEINKYSHPSIDDLPDFTGGIIGYLSFESISLIEEVIKFRKDELNLPDAILYLFKDIVVFDHYKHQIIIISNAIIDTTFSLKDSYNKTLDHIQRIRESLFKNSNSIGDFDVKQMNDDFQNNDQFLELVKKAKMNILEGDVFQIVLSNKFEADFSGDVFNVYRALRIINPSPYMFYLDFDEDLKIAGTSPEDLLKVMNKTATILPIAGTRPRGKDHKEDVELENNLLNDPKEIAEHVMLVDLARNDLGKVCNFDSIKITENMQVHKFSNVMHIVSRVEGILRDSKDCIDALQACFPAGTVTGAPKIKAIQLISEYENQRRNIYAGSIGYIDFNGNLDMCITIRTLYTHKNKLIWQAGAGIVADSVPESERQEILNKSAAIRNALTFAREINENFNNR